ncbi:MAG: peptide chain release factor-like protein [Proteobacteria bacterium]|nr:peptide chain release factor-like protein [Pseudomonadota bacterium]
MSDTSPPYSLDRVSLIKVTRIDTFKAKGPGGQHVNKTNSAIRLTHFPSGTVIICRNSSSQLRNRETAFSRLIKKLGTLNQVPKVRLATHPTRGSQLRRIKNKKIRGLTKVRRHSPEY